MREKRDFVNGIDPSGRHRETLLYVPLFASEQTLQIRRQRQTGDDIGVAHIGVGPFVPGDHQRLQALLRRPEMVPDHRHCIIQLDDLTHPFDFPRVRIVDIA